MRDDDKYPAPTAATLPLEHEIAAANEHHDGDLAKEVVRARLKETLFRKPITPTRIGRLIVLEPLGSGAMGEVFAAYDEKLDRRVALKLVRRELTCDSQASRRLIREAQDPGPAYRIPTWSRSTMWAKLQSGYSWPWSWWLARACGGGSTLEQSWPRKSAT